MAEDIGDLEGYVRATSVMLFFLSKKYFGSRNCLKEIRATLEQKKPLVLVQEQQEDKGEGQGQGSGAASACAIEYKVSTTVTQDMYTRKVGEALTKAFDGTCTNTVYELPPYLVRRTAGGSAMGSSFGCALRPSSLRRTATI